LRVRIVSGEFLFKHPTFNIKGDFSQNEDSYIKDQELHKYAGSCIQTSFDMKSRMSKQSDRSINWHVEEWRKDQHLFNFGTRSKREQFSYWQAVISSHMGDQLLTNCCQNPVGSLTLKKWWNPRKIRLVEVRASQTVYHGRFGTILESATFIDKISSSGAPVSRSAEVWRTSIENFSWQSSPLRDYLSLSHRIAHWIMSPQTYLVQLGTQTGLERVDVIWAISQIWQHPEICESDPIRAQNFFHEDSDSIHHSVRPGLNTLNQRTDHWLYVLVSLFHQKATIPNVRWSPTVNCEYLMTDSDCDLHFSKDFIKTDHNLGKYRETHCPLNPWNWFILEHSLVPHNRNMCLGKRILYGRRRMIVSMDWVPRST
jgi:hypothetical protein